MLGKISQWWAARLEEKEDEYLRQRYDALTRLKVATLEVLQAAEDRAQAAERVADEVAQEEAQATGTNDAVAGEEEAVDTPQTVLENNTPPVTATPTAGTLTHEDECVHALCVALDGCVKLGMKRGGGAEAELSWWHVLYSSTLLVDEPALVQTILSAALLSETDAGKERCWLKLALNNHTLEVSLMMIFSLTCEQLIRTSYEEWSLMRCSEGLALFLQMVIEIRSVQFAIQANDEPFHGAPEVPPPPPALPNLFPPPSPTNATVEGGKEDASVAPTSGDTTATTASAGVTTTPTDADQPTMPTPTTGESTPADSTVETAGVSSNPTTPPNEEEFVELSTVNFLHRHKGIKPWQHVFGVSLAYLCKNPYHSRFALIDPVLAIPNLVRDCIDFLMEHPDAPRLFRATVLNVHMNQLREIVETDGVLPPDIDPNGAGALLLDFFKNLPDSLLTSERYDAFVASGHLRDEEASVRNITCLVQDLPVHCKFVLEKVIGLMHVLRLPEHAQLNGVDAMTTALALAPVIAFKLEPAHALPSGHRRSTHTQYQDVRYAAVGAQVVERMIQHYDVIFQDVRLQVSDALKRLEAKKQALLTVHQLFKMKPQVNFMSDKQHLDELSILFAESIRSIECGRGTGNRTSLDSNDGAQQQPACSPPRSPASNNTDDHLGDGTKLGDSDEGDAATGPSEPLAAPKPPSSPRVHGMVPIGPKGLPPLVPVASTTTECSSGPLLDTSALLPPPAASGSSPPSSPTDAADLRTASDTGIHHAATFRTASGTGTRIGVLTRRQTVATTTAASSSTSSEDGIGRSRAASEFQSPYADPNNRSLVEIWEKHGFNRPTVLGNFDKGGVLLLRAVAYMIKHHKSEVLPRLYERALPCATASFDTGLVASAICRSLVHLLKLTPMPETPSLNLVALSVEPFWELFDEDAYFFKLFVLMFHMFDQIWSLLDPQEASFTRVFCETEAKMDKLLKKSPASVDEMRSQWNEVYQELHHEIAGELLDHNTADASADGLMAVVNAALDGNGSTLADGQAASPSSTFGPPSPPRLCRRPSFVINTDDYKGKLLDASGILSLEHVAYLDHAVPLTCQLCRWCLLYSTEVHGSSLDTLLLLAKNQSPTLLVVKDDHGNVFGGLATDEWHRATQYFGNGESFLYSFANAKTPSTGGPSSSVVTSDAGGTSVNVFTKYPWSRKNSYFMLCSEESLVMGGGGSFGLYLDCDLSSGTTGPCETFSSRPLVGSQEFNCVLVELWGFTSGDGPTRPSEPRKKSVLD